MIFYTTLKRKVSRQHFKLWMASHDAIPTYQLGRVLQSHEAVIANCIGRIKLQHHHDLKPRTNW